MREYPDSLPVPVRLQSSLSSLRQVLLHSPGQLSLATTGPLLEEIVRDLASLPHLNPKPSPAELSEIRTLSASVQSLYQGGLGFITDLSALSIQNGAWDAAAYSADGLWNSSSLPQSSRLMVEG
ncbi:MAG: hypothetical protein ACK5TN_05650 [Acidobacteriota bacterium]|jgi:hypothetical protein